MNKSSDLRITVWFNFKYMLGNSFFQQYFFKEHFLLQTHENPIRLQRICHKNETLFYLLV